MTKNMTTNMTKIVVGAAVALLLAGCGSAADDAGTVTEPFPVSSPTESESSGWSAEGNGNDSPVEEASQEENPQEEASQEEPVDVEDGSISLDDATALLTVQPEQYSDSYDQDSFNYWLSTGNSCDVRDEVLKRDGQNVTVGEGCSLSGTWVGAYTGETGNDPSAFDIDHFIPREEAWVSGAWGWDDDTRERFANDLEYAPTLQVTTASANRSKQSSDIAEWMNVQDVCKYASDWVGVKYRWGLSIDPAEEQRLNDLAGTECAGITLELPETAQIGRGATPVPDEAPNAAETATEAPESNSEGSGGNDPQFSSCKEAKAAGYGPYVSGTDIEYDWYRDGDGDGTACE